MSQPHQYNSLGQFIQEGGAAPSGIMVSRGESMDTIRQFIGRRVRDMPEDQFQRFYRVLLQGRDAARKMRELDDDQYIDPSLVPILPDLFGGDPAGRRGLLIVEAQRDDMSRPWQINLEQEDFWTRDRLEQIISEIIKQWKEQYPDLFNQLSGRKLRGMAITELWTARRF